MSQRNAPAPQFPKGAPALVTSMQAAALSVSRLTVEAADGEDVDVTMPGEDAFVVLYQLRDHPAHQLRLNGTVREIGPTPRQTLNVVDLGGEPYARMRQPIDTLMFHLPRMALDELADDAGGTRIDRLVAPDAWHTTDAVLDALHGLVVDALFNGEPANRLLHDHLLCGLGAHFAAAYGGLRPHRTMRGGLAPWQQRRAEELLAANLGGGLSIDTIARECALSPAYFARAFKRSTRTTPHAWLQRRRIDKAKQLLGDRELQLSEIALSCGFADQSHFTRTFARLAGLTPGAWRRLQ